MPHRTDLEWLSEKGRTVGELRQCGNLSGHCIGFNPWAKPLEAGQSAPVQLLKHAQQLQEESEAAAKAETAESERKARPR